MQFVVKDLCFTSAFSKCEKKLISKMTFQLSAGQILLVRGANGSGKTTLLKLLAGLLTPDAGYIAWAGEVITQIRDQYYQNISYLAYKSSIKQFLTPLENIQSAYLLSGGSHKTNIIEKAKTILARLELAAYINTPCQYLSAGQFRKVAIASLVLQEKNLWLLDEPFTALDTASSKTVNQLLAEQQARGGIIILTSHIAVENVNQTIDLGIAC